MSGGFLGDLMQTISDRGRRAIGQAWLHFDLPSGVLSVPQLLEHCNSLLSRRGEASGVALAAAILKGFAALPDDQRMLFLDGLETYYGPDPVALEQAVENYRKDGNSSTLRALQDAVEPRRQELIRRLNLAPGGTGQLVEMRRDVLRLSSDPKRWAALDADFVHLLGSWFNRGFLVMRRINWDTPARILEKIIRYEAVHAIGGWDDLRRRIEPEDRRLFAFFHPRLIDEPLIFVEVALTSDIPSAIAPLLEQDRTVQPAALANTAVFYSISNCQDGLKGISFGHFLIKQVAEDLKQEQPGLTNFVTLSPSPGFASWLSRSADPDDMALAGKLEMAHWQHSEAETATLRPLVERAAARYYTSAKRPDGRPVDPVSRFHLGNGASLDRINWPADTSENAVRTAHGLMVNYRYDLAKIEENHESFAERGIVITSSAVKRLCSRSSGTMFQRVKND